MKEPEPSSSPERSHVHKAASARMDAEAAAAENAAADTGRDSQAAGAGTTNETKGMMMRQYLIAVVIAVALCVGLCIAYAAEQRAHGDYVQAQRGPK
jgi:hypothetical protein